MSLLKSTVTCSVEAELRHFSTLERNNRAKTILSCFLKI